MSISTRWGFPYYTGLGQTAVSVPDPYPIAIGGRRYAVDLAKCTRGIISPMRDSRDNNALPGEAALNPLAAWKRNRDDWTLGQGQVWADRALEPYNVKIELEPRQYRYSKGIDPWTLGQFQLHPDTELFAATANSLLKLLTIGTTYMYKVDGSSLQRTQDPDAASVTWTTITGLSGTIYDITTDGYYVYIGTSVGIFIHDSTTTTATAMGGAAATFNVIAGILFWANGWLFASSYNQLYTVAQSGAMTLQFTHNNPQFIFRSGAGAPGAIYVGGQPPGEHNQIYSINVGQSGALNPPIHAMSLPRSETLNIMRYYGTFMLLGTNRGIRVAEIGTNSTLVMSPVITTPNSVMAMAADGHQIWWALTNYDSSSTGLGRSDLSISSDINSFVPAYASDLMYAGQGQVQTIARFKGKTYFGLGTLGFVRQERTGKYVASGSLSMGRYRWGTYEPKVFLGIEAVSTPLPSGTSVAMFCTADDGTNVGLGSRAEVNSTGLGTIYGIGAMAKCHDWFDPLITLSSDAATRLLTPTINRVTLRALPTPKIVEQFQMALMMADVVNLESGEGQDQPYDTADEFNYLRALVQNGIPVAFQLGHSTYFCTVRDLQWAENEINGWNFERKGFNGILVVTLVTAEM